MQKKNAQKLSDEQEQDAIVRKSPHDLKIELLQIMQPTETVTRTMNRLSGGITTIFPNPV